MRAARSPMEWMCVWIPSAIESEDCRPEDVGVHHRRTAIFAANVRLEQGGRARFERPVDAELGGRDLEPRAAIFAAARRAMRSTSAGTARTSGEQ